jgi:hypothetical protein
MNKYSVVLYSDILDGSVWINFLVNTPMTLKQIKTYYECLSLSISKVEILEIKNNNLSFCSVL